jgi:hypothetical protein
MVAANSGASSRLTSFEKLGRRPLGGLLVQWTGGYHADGEDDDMLVGACS